MFVAVAAELWLLYAVGLNHVEILQTSVIFFGLAFSCVALMLNVTPDLKKFFVFSELAWVLIFGTSTLSIFASSTALLAMPFFVLVLTACEALVVACVLLISFESKKSCTAVGSSG